MDYGRKREAREAPLFARVTRADQALIRAAAEAEGLSVSSYVAEVATQAARRDLFRTNEQEQSDR